MLEYLDGQYTVLQDTLLAVNNQDNYLQIPSRLGECTLLRIGAGCSLGEKTISVTVPEGVLEIGEKAFANAPNLRNLFLPESLQVCSKTILGTGFYLEKSFSRVYLNRKITETDYKEIMGNSIELENGYRLLTGAYQKLEFFSGIVPALGEILPPAFVIPQMKALYCEREKATNPEQMIFAGGRERVIIEANQNERAFHKSLIKIMLKEKKEYICNVRCEEHSDRVSYISNSLPRSEQVLLCMFRTNEVKKSDDGYHMLFHFRFSKVWFYDLWRVMVNGKNNAILRKCYLSPSEKEPFVYEDYINEIYDEEGNYSDRTARNETISKYLFLSVLK